MRAYVALIGTRYRAVSRRESIIDFFQTEYRVLKLVEFSTDAFVLLILIALQNRISAKPAKSLLFDNSARLIYGQH